jgi:hypothetical protein
MSFSLRCWLGWHKVKRIARPDWRWSNDPQMRICTRCSAVWKRYFGYEPQRWSKWRRVDR